MRPQNPFLRALASLAAAGLCAALTGCIIVNDQDGDDWDRSYVRGLDDDDDSWIGVDVAEPSEATAAQLNLDRDDATVLTRVVRSSPADRAGLRRLDVVARIDGSDQAGPSDLTRAVRRVRPGESLTLQVYRGGQPMDVVVSPEPR